MDAVLEALETLETPTESIAQPDWWTSLRADYRAGMANVFILTGNVHDYVECEAGDLPLREYLERRLVRTHTVASFAPDQGITFHGNELVAREARARFDAALGVEAAPPVDPNSPSALLRAATGGGFGGGSGEVGPLPTDAPTAVGLLVDFATRANENDEAAQVGLVGPKTARRQVRKRAAVIIERADLIVPPEDKARLSGADRALLSLLHRSGTSLEINGRKNLIILLAASIEEIHPDLRLASSNIRAIEVPMPDDAQRLSYIARMLPKRRVTLDGLSEADLASETAGLGRRHIEDIAMRAAARGGVLGRDLVKDRKAELIKAEYAEVLEVLEPDVTWEQVGGHGEVKSYLRRRVLRTMRDPQLHRRCPMGLLFAGPSGTGKTFLVRALARESGYNCVSLAADKIRGSFVGESERKLAKALQGIKALAPCIVFLDEIDQKVKRVTGGGGGGGDMVEGNIFGSLLEFFSDTEHRGRILLVAATNRPDQIDAAFKRPGRIDAKIPLLPPDDATERALALRALVARHGLDGASDAALLAVGEQTEGWTQAELEALVGSAGAMLDLEAPPSDDVDPIAWAFEEALEEMVPSTDDIALHTELAVRACSNRKLVPERWRYLVGKQAPKKAARADGAPVGRQAIESDDADDDLFADDDA